MTLVAASVVLLALQTPAAACSCDVPPSLDDEVAGSVAVFTATVAETRQDGRDHDDLVARMVVDEVFKGDVAEVVEVATAADDGMCGLGFGQGDRWLLYAGQRSDGSLTAHDCGRSAIVAYADGGTVAPAWAEEDLAELGVGEAPRPGEQLRADPPLPWGTILGVVAMLAVIVVAVHLTRVARSAPDDPGS